MKKNFNPSEWLNKKMNISFLKDKQRLVIHNGINVNIFNSENIKKDNKTAEYIKAKHVIMDDVISICHIDGEKKILKDKIDINMLNKALNIYSNK